MRFWLREWGVPIAVGLPLAALIIWLGPWGPWLFLALQAAIVGGAAWFASESRRPATRAAVTLGAAAFAFLWPPAFFAVVYGEAGFVGRLIAVSPAIWIALFAARRREPGDRPLALAALAFAALPWIPAHAAWKVGVAGAALLALALAFAPRRGFEWAEVSRWGVSRTLPGDQIERVAWSDLVSVEIATSGRGPAADFWWLLRGVDGGVAVSAGRAGDLLERLARLPGFDHEAVARAAGSTRAAWIPCWRGSVGEARVCGDL